MRWAIYYDDGTTYRDTDGTPYDAPSRGVVVVAQEDADVGRVLFHRRDYYYFDSAIGWRGGDLFGLYDYLTRPGPRRVVFGRTVADAAYRDILRAATDDPYLPRKSALAAWERV